MKMKKQPRCRETGSGADSFSKASQSFAADAAKGSPIIFFGDMCVEENTSRPANVRAVRLGRTARAMQSGRKPLCQKVILFDSLSPAAGKPAAGLLQYRFYRNTKNSITIRYANASVIGASASAAVSRQSSSRSTVPS